MKINFIPQLQMIPAAAAAAIPAIGAMYQGASQIITNRQNQKFQRQQYERQRDDELKFWNMQNQYNSPQQQMQRLKEAGLNPNLAYGSVNNEAAHIGAPSVAPARNEAPQFDIGSVLSQYVQNRQTMQQTDNLAKQNELLDTQKALMEANIFKTLADTNLKRFELSRGGQLLPLTLEAMETNIKNIATRTAQTAQATAQAGTMFPHQVENIIKRNQLLYQQTRNEQVKENLLRETVKQVIENTALAHQKTLTEQQKTQLTELMVQNQITRNSMAGTQYDGMKIANSILRMKEDAMKWGVSPEFTENLIDKFLGMLSLNPRRR